MADRDPPRLRELSDEVARIARTLSALAAQEPAGGRAASAREGQDRVDASYIRSIIRARRLRDQFLPADLFGEPAWDMILDLYAATLEGRQVAVSSLCIASAVSASTAIRWIKALTDAGIFVRAEDDLDRRRSFINLSESGKARLDAYFASLRRLMPPI